MKRVEFVSKRGEETAPEPKNFSAALKSYYVGLQINNLVMDAVEMAENIINEDITWVESISHDYLIIKIMSHNKEVWVSANDLEKHTKPSLAQLIADTIRRPA